MKVDDPKEPEFASWRSYLKFARRVRQTRRYVWQIEVQAFLDTVRATLKDRDVKIPVGTIFYRAQEGIDYESVVGDDGNVIGEEAHGFGAVRMGASTAEAYQLILLVAGFYKGAIDGDFGSASQQALRDWTTAGCP